MARVRRDTDSEDTTLNMDRMSHKDQMSNHVNQVDEEDEEDVLYKVDQVSNLLPSAQTIATVMRGIADVADLYGS